MHACGTQGDHLFTNKLTADDIMGSNFVFAKRAGEPSTGRVAMRSLLLPRPELPCCTPLPDDHPSGEELTAPPRPRPPSLQLMPLSKEDAMASGCGDPLVEGWSPLPAMA